MKLKFKQTVRVLAKGGILTPSYMLGILKIARQAGNAKVHLGSRQDLLFDVGTKVMPKIQTSFSNLNIDYIIHGKGNQNAQNIISSYVASDIVASTPWLSSGNFLFILDNFRHLPKLRINLIDPAQSLVPYFFGNLNFIASPIQHYWYLYIRISETELPVRWPVMILNTDIAALSKCIEENWYVFASGVVSDWFEHINVNIDYNSRKIENDLQLDFKYPLDYEGFGKMYNSHNYWAGFYWRNNSYEIDFLEELCNLCLRTGISKICFTPWKSFIVKEIQEKDLLHWNRLLGRFGITMRHSSFELNWHLPLQDNLALRLKRSIVRKFDHVDVCVHGLTFGIKTKAEPSFYAIKVERKPGLRFLKGFDIFATYDISFAKDFNPNLCQYIEYVSNVPRHRVPAELQKLTLKFYSQLTETATIPNKVAETGKETSRTVHQCKHCLSIYDDTLGIADMGISALTSFADLPDTFTCPLCDAPKEDFRHVQLTHLYKTSVA